MDLPFRSAVVSWREITYRCIKKLGGGGAGSVFAILATSGPFNGKIFAEKFFEAFNRPVEWYRSFMKEINVLRSCKHPAIIEVFDEGVYQDKYPFLVMEYMQGSLADIRKKKVDLTDNQKISIVVQLLSALNYLSRLDPPGVHRDIKPQNILFKGTSCVLGDFGLLSLLHSQEKPESWERPKIMPMAQNYRTPELVPFARDGTPLPPASDVFQLGLVAAELFTGQNPLEPSGGMNRVELREIGEVFGRHAVTVRALLQDMLVTETAERLTAPRALARWQELYLKSFEPESGKPRKLAGS